MSRFFAKESIIAQPGYNRWKVPPASIAIHLCIGSVYAWSIYNPALTRIIGVVGSAADDWSPEVVWIFTNGNKPLPWALGIVKGHSLGRSLGSDEVNVCYVEPGAEAMVGCTLFKRQKQLA